MYLLVNLTVHVAERVRARPPDNLLFRTLRLRTTVLKYKESNRQKL